MGISSWGTKKIGFLGTGNMAQSVISALLDSGTLSPQQIFASNRTPGKLNKVVSQFGIVPVKTNEDLVDQCDVIFVGVKPQDLVSVLEPVSSSLTHHHIVISMAAGIPMARLMKLLPNTQQIVRVIPNTPVKIRQGVIGYYLSKKAVYLKSFLEDFLKPLGTVIGVEDEDLLASLSVGCSAGVGFVLELMQYWQEWLEEHDFSASQAREMTVQTFLGAAQLARQSEVFSLTEIQSRVVSKRGITAAGLGSMRELEVERLLRYSFEKSALRDQELSQERIAWRK